MLHFVCHGKLDDRGETVLYWAEADNQVLPVKGEKLLDELSNIGGPKGLPHFAFLCTCESADPRAEGALGGLAQRLVRDLGMPAVIAMTRKVSVETGLALGQSFYRRLRESGEVDTALQEATAGLSKRHDITVPALFSRLGGRPLFSDRLEDRELTDLEINKGIEKLRQLFRERAPHASVLKQRLETQDKRLENTRGAESRTAREDRHQAIVELNNLCEQVIEISFDALAALGKQPPEYKAECPFPGLSSFGDKKYHKFFFGRDELIRDLQKELAKDNFLAVIGTSGRGKSSVVLAGLIPKLKEEEPSLQWAYMTPGKEPLRQLKRRFERLWKVSEQHSILVVDQFEEVFTLCEDKAERVEFIEKLLNFADRRKVVITMRADFFGECTFYPELRKRIETRQKLVGPMEPAELITAMKMQADKAELRFEAGLSDSILNDVKKEAGAMPLLQYALQELWKRRHGWWLCHEEYQAIGRVEQAIAKTADDFYNSLPASEQEQVRNIFLRLTRMYANAVQGKERQGTGRRVELEDLVSAGDDLAVTKKLVQQLAGEKARLVVTSRNEATEKDEVEVAHEALISYWPKLQKWLDENRNDLLLRQDINDAAQKWQQHQEQLDKDSYLTHKGGRLEDAEKLLKQPKLVHLNPLEAEYVKACVQLRDRQERDKEEQRQRESYQEKKATKAAQTRNRIASISAVGLAAFAIFAVWQWRQTTLQRNIALVKNILSTEPTKALTLAITTTKQSSTEFNRQFLGSAESALFSALDAAREQKVFRGHKGAVTSVAFSPDGQMIASTGEDGKIRLWELDGTSEKIDNQAPAIAVVFNPKDKNILASLNKDGTLKLWDLRDYPVQLRPQILSNRSINVTSVAFNPQDRYVFVTGGQDGKVQLWNLKNNTSKIIGTRKSAVYTIAFSPDGKTIAVGGKGKNIQLWNLDGKNTAPKELLAGDKSEVDTNGAGCITTIKFYHNKYSTNLVSGERMGSLALQSKLHIWQINERSTPTDNSISAHNFSIYSLDVSQNGAIVSSGDDGTIQLHDLEGKLLTKQPLIGHEIKNESFGPNCPQNSGVHDSVAAVAFSPDGQTIVSGGSDGTVRLWSAEALPGLKVVPVKTVGLLQGRSTSPIYENFPKTLRFFRPNGSQIEMINKRDTVEWKDINDTNFKPRSHRIPKYFYSPDGERIATVTQGSTVEVRDKQGKLLGNPFDVVKGNPFDVVKVVKLGALNSKSKRIVLVDRENGIQVRDFKGNLVGNSFQHEGQVSDIAISPDGQTIVTASSVGVPGEGISSSTLRLWDIHGNLITKFDLSDALFGRESYPAENSLLAFSPSGKSMIAYSRLIISSVMIALPSNSQILLEAACNRLRYHPILNNPTTLNLNKNEIEVSRQAKDICQRDVWNNQPMH